MENERMSLASSGERYSRQLTDEWTPEKQKILHNSSVLLLGSDILGQMVLGGLVGIGVGNILVMDNAESKKISGFLDVNSEYRIRSENIAATAKKINPYIKIKGINSQFASFFLSYEGFKPDVVVDATNNISSKQKALDYCELSNTDFISAYCNHKKSVLSCYKPNENAREVLESFNILEEDPNQGVVTSGVTGGIIVDEVRKRLFSLNERDNALESRVTYNLCSKDRKSLNAPASHFKDLRDSRILVVGAGAIGTFASISLALSGFKNIDILDYDVVENTNLNRQILFYESLGEKKAQVLSHRITALRKLRSHYFCRDDEKIGENSRTFFRKNKYDLIMGCLDNVRARYYLNEIAVEFGIPYIDGATSDLAGNLAVYFPGKTPCIKCKKGLSLENDIKRSCGQALPSVIIPNMIIGSAMVGETANLLSGNLLEMRFAYDSFNPQRTFLRYEVNPQENCKCLSLN